MNHQLTPEQLELAELIVKTLNLELPARSIDADEPLFGDEGLALDSIDALEIAYAIFQHYQVKLKSSDANNEHIFASLAALSDHIQQNLPK